MLRLLLPLVSLFFLMLGMSACNPTASQKEDSTKSAQTKSTQIDAYLQSVQELHEIPGMAVAILQKGEVIYQNCLGVASLENQTPLHAHHMLRVYSTTKLLSSTAIFQLIEQGKLSLEDPITQYIDDIPLEWGKVSIGDMLAHASGLPDIIRYPDTTDEALLELLIDDGFEFEPGQQFRYNQTNYWFLARIIQKVTGQTFADFILEHQFPNGTSEALFSSNSQITIPNRISKYEYDNQAQQFVPTSYKAGAKGHAGN
ncbi:MAG: serine hydrolase domain-containing protein, partial [Bacteroidota bacterium]